MELCRACKLTKSCRRIIKWHRVSLSPILFSVFINNLLVEVEKAGLGVQLNNGKSIGGLLFADDFVGMSDSREN